MIHVVVVTINVLGTSIILYEACSALNVVCAPVLIVHLLFATNSGEYLRLLPFRTLRWGYLTRVHVLVSRNDIFFFVIYVSVASRFLIPLEAITPWYYYCKHQAPVGYS